MKWYDKTYKKVRAYLQRYERQKNTMKAHIHSTDATSGGTANPSGALAFNSGLHGIHAVRSLVFCVDLLYILVCPFS